MNVAVSGGDDNLYGTHGAKVDDVVELPTATGEALCAVGFAEPTWAPATVH
jgi:hypothetical protein